MAISGPGFLSALVCVLAVFSQLCQFVYYRGTPQATSCGSHRQHTDSDTSTDTGEGYTDYLVSTGSSVWCHGNNHTDRMCRFHNLCYIPQGQTFVFFQGPQSILFGVPTDRFDKPFLDLSTVADHNAHLFSYEEVAAKFTGEVLGQRCGVVEEMSLLLSRFLPDNLMHVIHDDLLPLYHTLRALSWGRSLPSPVQLVYTDSLPATDFQSLYNLFTTRRPQTISEMTTGDGERQAVCFREVWVGFHRKAWYQYGFVVPQGPLFNRPKALDIQQFTTYVQAQTTGDYREIDTVEHYVPSKEHSDVARGHGPIILVSRKETRRIMNELELCLTLANDLGRTVVTVSLETHAVEDLIAVFGRAAMVVGMHGSLLVLSMFLPRGAILLELFPYGVPPDNYTPYRTLATITGLVYRAWSNEEVSRTVTHPDWPPELGGLAHLHPDTRAAIQARSTVPPHLCCTDPHWLFRINQDTFVDPQEVLALIQSGLAESEAQTVEDNLVTSTYPEHPGKVRNPQCHTDCGERSPPARPCLLVTWTPPWNYQFLQQRDIRYEVLVQIEGQNNHTNYVTESERLVVTDESVFPSTTYLLWIRPQLDVNHRGMFVYMSCVTPPLLT